TRPVRLGSRAVVKARLILPDVSCLTTQLKASFLPLLFPASGGSTRERKAQWPVAQTSPWRAGSLVLVPDGEPRHREAPEPGGCSLKVPAAPSENLRRAKQKDSLLTRDGPSALSNPLLETRRSQLAGRDQRGSRVPMFSWVASLPLARQTLSGQSIF